MALLVSIDLVHLQAPPGLDLQQVLLAVFASFTGLQNAVETGPTVDIPI